MRLVVGMSGSSGSTYGIRLLETLRHATDIETHLVVSRWARASIEYETEHTLADVYSLATAAYDISDLDAQISRASFHTDGMVIAPCSVKSLTAILSGRNDNLLARAASTHLRTRRKLVVQLQKAPTYPAHIHLIQDVTDAGAIIVAPECGPDAVLARFGIERSLARS